MERKAEMALFESGEFGKIRTIEEEGKILFCGKDVGIALGYSNQRDAIRQHCRKEGVVKRSVGVQTGFKADGSPAMQVHEMTFIDEGNVYRLICRSKLESAERFERWVFEEVLPSMRTRNGFYAKGGQLEELEEAVANLRSQVEALSVSTDGEEWLISQAMAMPMQANSLKGTIDRLPKSEYIWIMRELAEGKRTYKELAEELTARGYPISKERVRGYANEHILLVEIFNDRCEITTDRREHIKIYDDGRMKKTVFRGAFK